jgi:hypothetical protein
LACGADARGKVRASYFGGGGASMWPLWQCTPHIHFWLTIPAASLAGVRACAQARRARGLRERLHGLKGERRKRKGLSGYTQAWLWTEGALPAGYLCRAAPRLLS